MSDVVSEVSPSIILRTRPELAQELSWSTVFVLKLSTVDATLRTMLLAAIAAMQSAGFELTEVSNSPWTVKDNTSRGRILQAQMRDPLTQQPFRIEVATHCEITVAEAGAVSLACHVRELADTWPLCSTFIASTDALARLEECPDVDAKLKETVDAALRDVSVELMRSRATDLAEAYSVMLGR